MGWRFRKSIKVFPGVRVNLGKKGVSSVSIGGSGITTNINSKGVRNTYSTPGTGISYQTQRTGFSAGPTAPSAQPPTSTQVAPASPAAASFVSRSPLPRPAGAAKLVAILVIVVFSVLALLTAAILIVRTLR